jgi:hypothetical protein
MNTISQLDPKYAGIKFPGTEYLYSSYGCLTSAICMLLEKDPIQFMAENPNGWSKSGDLQTDSVLAKYGFKLVREAIPEGSPLPVKSERYIAKTSFMKPKYPTHFYVVNPDNTITDPGSQYNPKSINRYAQTTNEIRFLTKIGSAQIAKQNLTLEERVSRLESKRL